MTTWQLEIIDSNLLDQMQWAAVTTWQLEIIDSNLLDQRHGAAVTKWQLEIIDSNLLDQMQWAAVTTWRLEMREPPQVIFIGSSCLKHSRNRVTRFSTIRIYYSFFHSSKSRPFVSTKWVFANCSDIKCVRNSALSSRTLGLFSLTIFSEPIFLLQYCS